MGSRIKLYQRRPGGAWWVSFWHGGRPYRKSSGTAKREEAQEWGERYKASLWRADRLGERSTVTWGDAVVSWAADNQRLATIVDRNAQLDWATQHLARLPLHAIDGPKLRELAAKKAVTTVRGKQVSAATVNRTMAAVSAVLHHAFKAGMLSTLPPIEKRREPKVRVKWATEEQALALIASLPREWAIKAAFSLETGLRRHNVTHLEWSAVDLKRSIAWVHADEAKGGRVIRVSLTPEAVEILTGQKGAHAVYCFPGERSTPVERIEAKVWRAACNIAGLADFRWHDLRHTWASWHVQNGTTLEQLQVLGGWSSFSQVQKYAHLMPSHVASAAANSGLGRARLRLLQGGVKAA